MMFKIKIDFASTVMNWKMGKSYTMINNFHKDQLARIKMYVGEDKADVAVVTLKEGYHKRFSVEVEKTFLKEMEKQYGEEKYQEILFEALLKNWKDMKKDGKEIKSQDLKNAFNEKAEELKSQEQVSIKM